VTGGGWELPAFDGRLGLEELDAWVPDVPAALASADGHALWVNSAALALAGLDAESPDPAGGRLERRDGRLTGVLHEAAMEPVLAVLPEADEATWDVGLAFALAEARAVGITTILDPSADEPALAAYGRAAERGELTLRVHAAVEVEGPEDVPRLVGLAGGAAHVGYAKLYLDGVLETGTAALLAPYADGSLPLPHFDDATLRATLEALRDARLRPHAHAIGDAAVRQFLDAVEATASTGAVVAHVELVDPDDIRRFAQLGVAASFTALWAWPDPYVVELTYPKLDAARNGRLYPIGEVHRSGGLVVGGSDWSVSSMDPLDSIEVGLTRRNPDGPSPPLAPDQAVDA
jgi:predicted amidohydrolase YtcJ